MNYSYVGRRRHSSVNVVEFECRFGATPGWLTFTFTEAPSSFLLDRAIDEIICAATVDELRAELSDLSVTIAVTLDPKTLSHN